MSKPFNIAGNLDHELQLARPGFDHTRTGYNIRDTNFVLEHVSKTEGVGFLDTLDLLTPQHNNREYLTDRILDAVEKSTVVTGEVFFYPNENGGLQMLEVLMPMLRQCQQGEMGPRRIIMPLNIAYAHGEKENHAMVLLIEEHPERQGEYRIALLEQHARSDGSKLDYSQEKQMLRERLTNLYPMAEVYENVKPLCTAPHVCGIVSLAVCKKLLGEKDSFTLAKNTPLLSMNTDAVQEEHAANVSLAMRSIAHDARQRRHEGHSPT